MTTPVDWRDIGYRTWPIAVIAPDPDHPSRALVLGGGGATGVAWLGGLAAGLRDVGVELRDADTIVGTSAGSVAGAHLRLDDPETTADVSMENFLNSERFTGLGRIGGHEAFNLIRGALHPNRGAGRRLVGMISTGAHTLAEEEFIRIVSRDLEGADWPEESLLITAVDVRNGTPVVFHKDSGVPLQLAMAASCAVPGVFPPITIGGRRYMDGGVRSVANVDLAAGHDRVLVLAPIPFSLGRRGNPSIQARELRDHSRTLTVVPDAATRRAVGLGVLDMHRTRPAYEAGFIQAERIAGRVEQLWTN